MDWPGVKVVIEMKVAELGVKYLEKAPWKMVQGYWCHHWLGSYWS